MRTKLARQEKSAADTLNRVGQRCSLLAYAPEQTLDFLEVFEWQLLLPSSSGKNNSLSLFVQDDKASFS